jgi:WD40 repeat protein
MIILPRPISPSFSQKRLSAALIALLLFFFVGCASPPRRPLAARTGGAVQKPQIVGWKLLPKSVIAVTSEGAINSASIPNANPERLSTICRISADTLPIFSAATSSDGQLVAVSMRGVVRVVALSDCHLVAETRLIDSRIGSLAFSPDSRSIIMGAFDGKVYRWRFLESGGFSENQHLLFERYVGHGGVVSSVAFHPAGRVFFSSDWTGSLRAWLRYDQDDYKGRWDVVTGPGRFYTEVAVAVSAARFSEPIDSLVVSSQGDYLLTSTRDGSVQLWSIRGFLLRGQISAHDGQIRSIALSGSGELAATSGRDGFIRLWRISSGENDGKQAEFSKISEWYQPDNRYLAIDDQGRIITIGDEQFQVLNP